MGRRDGAGGQSFASSDCGDAFQQFQRALREKLDQRVEELEEAGQDVGSSADAYSAGDQYGAVGLGGLL
ncbi:hypothetical protein A8924_6461 [Saccharopolyspora erythraea NRRL 2338]|uniref:Uncharacterized protein n=2 Tax=Saccharopolyspora erythraea TaxID=1836 RepID=A4FML2_SACEN|nr:hypothetical protein [Saccharopolyspora erythraea]EQD85546.1 hypothetical protein N599_14330 [Saccharopolyspora erythraea D]PFG98935.1 hypothetical protein A8924_6461 [Saccharopolyspora erythraea NRRL 2338]QRK88919.1 hypothetical protein JQX30_30630 [Saccharopolyspora erythraea]CAM05287.1 hypothetical protein SACE_6114 [Saccharopolyspora erythraea NRRL 2338]